MTINLSKFETTIQEFANNVTTANTTTDFLNIAKAIKFSNAGQMVQYSSISQFPAANGALKQFAQDISTGVIYYSNNTNWIICTPPSLAANLFYTSSGTGISPANLSTTSDTINTAFALAETLPGTGNALLGTGYNSTYMLGLGTTAATLSMTQGTNNTTDWKYISCGYGSTIGIKTDGTLWSWGMNNYGQLGQNSQSTISTPTQIGTGGGWKEVTSGKFHHVAIKTDGTLWSWGYNGYGQLGQGNTTMYSSPIQVGTLTNWKHVSGGNHSTLAIKTDGTLWACGYNNVGQLGLGNTTHQSSPVQVGVLTNWKHVVCSSKHMAAIKTDGTLWTCGYNNWGALGLGNTTSRSSPVQVGTLTNWKQVSCGTNNTVAIKTDGTLWSWGYDGYGQLGLGDTTTRSSPVQVGTLTNWKQLAWNDGYADFHAATKTDGTLWTWGYNNAGQLGQGNTTHQSSPVQVGSLTNWKSVSVGEKSLIAINYPISSPYLTGYFPPTDISTYIS